MNLIPSYFEALVESGLLYSLALVLLFRLIRRLDHIPFFTGIMAAGQAFFGVFAFNNFGKDGQLYLERESSQTTWPFGFTRGI